ncbi:MAG: chloride channel protein [Gemmatimonadales bacterium]|nr:MAG: chloride channel protein [Gemmatimonadales bacterium]
MLAAALVLGAATAVGVWLFKQTVYLIATGGWGWVDPAGPLWMRWPLLVVPVAGGLLVGLILHWTRSPEEPGHGVTEVIEAVKLDAEDMPYHRIGVKAPVAALSLGSGASLGPEDPAVEIGGSVGALAGARLGWSHDRVQDLVATGAAAGISAAFHAPLAAILFTVEVFGVRLPSPRMAWVAAGSLAAWTAMRVMAPDLVFRIPEQDRLTLWSLLFGVLLGVVAGAVGALLVRTMYAIQHAFLGWRSIPRWAKPGIGGVALGLVGLWLPQVLGIGYETIQGVVDGDRHGLLLLTTLLVAKLGLMALSFGSGFLGGFFAPAFFGGAVMGAMFGLGVEILVPGDPVTFAVVGMAALLAGIVHAPLTAVLLVAAVSDNYAVVPLLLLASLIAYSVSVRLVGASAYTYPLVHPPDAHPRP